MELWDISKKNGATENMLGQGWPDKPASEAAIQVTI
jgi:hypothetical protein